MREPLLPRLPSSAAPFASASGRCHAPRDPQTLVKKDIEFVRRIKGEILSE